jgi:hypothetical protein
MLSVQGRRNGAQKVPTSSPAAIGFSEIFYRTSSCGDPDDQEPRALGRPLALAASPRATRMHRFVTQSPNFHLACARQQVRKPECPAPLDPILPAAPRRPRGGSAPSLAGTAGGLLRVAGSGPRSRRGHPSAPIGLEGASSCDPAGRWRATGPDLLRHDRAIRKLAGLVSSARERAGAR